MAGLLAAGLSAAAPAAPGVAAAPSPYFHFDHVPGIPRGVVAAVAQDRRGLVWVGTGDGLAQWDGHALRPVERADADPVRRNLGWVRAMLSHRDGAMWLGTEAEGVLRHDAGTGAIEPVARPAGDADPAAVTALAALPDGRVVIAGEDGRLLLAAADGRASVALKAAPGTPSPAAPLAALAVDPAGRLWVGSGAGLLRGPVPDGTDDGRLRLAALELGGPPARITALALAPDGAVWAGAADGRAWRLPAAGGLQPVATGGAAVTRIAFDAGADGGAGPRGDGGFRAWIGRSAGIDLHAADGRRLHALRHDPGDASSLGADHVSALLADDTGAMWVGSFGGGLQRHRPPLPGLEVRLTQPITLPDGRRVPPDLRALLSWPDGRVWAGLHGGGIVELDADLVPRRVLPLDRPVEALALAGAGGAWVAGGGRVQRLGRDGRPLGRALEGVDDVLQMVEADDGRLWLAVRQGLLGWDAADASRGAAAEPARAADGSALPGRGLALARDASGALWAGTTTGLWRLPPRTGGAGGWQRVVSPPGAGLGNPTVNGLVFDAGGTLWLDTAVAGLHRARPAAAEARAADPGADPDAATGVWRVAFDRVSARHGRLMRPFGVNLLFGNAGRLWTHMHVYDPAADRLVEIGPVEGARLGTGWFGSRAVAADGRLLFGGSRGLLVVDDARFEPRRVRAPLVLTSLHVEGRPRRAGDELVLAPGERGFAVEFAALAYADTTRLRYAWRLEGHDADWIEGSPGQRAAAWGRLEPGEYRLRVRATDDGGDWDGGEATLALSVLPQWWQQRELQALGVALAALALLVALQRHTGRLRRRQIELEALVQERTAELERERAALQHASRTDPLTGLANRRHLQQHIDDDIAACLALHDRARAEGRPPPEDAVLLLFIVDIDHFKRLNDEHGHAAGDAVLAQMRERLLSVFRDGDHVVRWGGEEFLVVARGGPRRQAAALAERLRQAVGGRAFGGADGEPLAITCSTGFAAFPADPQAPRSLDWQATLRLADAALLKAKRDGRDRWCGVLELPAADDETARRLGRWLAGGVAADAAPPARLASGPAG